MMNPPFQNFDHRAAYVADMLRTLARSKSDLLAKAGLSESERFTLNRLAAVVTNQEIPSARDYRLLMSLAARLPQYEDAAPPMPKPRAVPSSRPQGRREYPPETDGSWGRKVKQLRQLQGLSLRRLGEAAKMAKQTVAKIEKGETRPTVEQLRRLFEALESGSESRRSE